MWGYEGVHYLWEGEARHFIIPKGSGLYLLLLSLLLSWVADFLVHQGVCRHGACGGNLFLLFGPALATLVAYFFVSPPLPIYTAYGPGPIFFKPLVKFLRFRGGPAEEKNNPVCGTFLQCVAGPLWPKFLGLSPWEPQHAPPTHHCRACVLLGGLSPKYCKGFFVKFLAAHPRGSKPKVSWAPPGLVCNPGANQCSLKKKGRLP